MLLGLLVALFWVYISSNRLEWMQHQGMYNEVLTSLHERFKSTVKILNGDVWRLKTQLQMKEMSLLSAKSKNAVNKAEVAGLRKEHKRELQELKKAHQVSLRKLCHKKNVLLTRVKALDSAGKSKKIQSKNLSNYMQRS